MDAHFMLNNNVRPAFIIHTEHFVTSLFQKSFSHRLLISHMIQYM